MACIQWTCLALLVAAATAAEPYHIEFDVTLVKARKPTPSQGKFVVESSPRLGAARGGVSKRSSTPKSGKTPLLPRRAWLYGAVGHTGGSAVAAKWKEDKILDDPVRRATSAGPSRSRREGKNSRTTQVFISFVDNANLDGMGFAPFGKVVEGMDVVDAIFSGAGGGQGRDPVRGTRAWARISRTSPSTARKSSTSWRGGRPVAVVRRFQRGVDFKHVNGGACWGAPNRAARPRGLYHGSAVSWSASSQPPLPQKPRPRRHRDARNHQRHRPGVRSPCRRVRPGRSSSARPSPRPSARSSMIDDPSSSRRL